MKRVTSSFLVLMIIPLILLIIIIITLLLLSASPSSSSSSSISFFVSAQNLRTPRPPGFYTAARMLNIRDQVVTFFRHAYNGYKTHAYPMDELKPVSCKGTDHFGHYSMTAIDALDTLALIGDYEEFFTIIEHLHKNVHFNADVTVSVFETTIRVIGSLTTAHDIALKLKDHLPVEQYPQAARYEDQLLQVCVRIADKMISAFDTPTGIPFNEINLKTGAPDPSRGHATCPAAAGSLILEFGYLSHLTGNCTYLQLARQAFLGLWKHRSPHNMVGMMIDIYNGFWLNTEANIGASVDSFYEYMVKTYVVSGDKMYLEMWEQASRSIYKHTYFSGWFLSSSVEYRGPMEAFDHRFNSLQTFWPGLQALSGDVTNAIDSFEKIHCITKTLTFPPEYISIAEFVTQQPNPKKSGPGYPLRPEIIESALYLHRATQDDYFLNVGEHFIYHLNRAKTRCGFAAILDVWQMTLEDKMESFLLSETFKYLYLMFTPPKWKPRPAHLQQMGSHPSKSFASTLVDLDEGFIFNTEAHPIPISSGMKETYKRCSTELRILPHMSENVLKDDWTVHDTSAYEHFTPIPSDINHHQRKCPTLDNYWRDIAPHMDSLRNHDRCFEYVDTSILISKQEMQNKPREMPQPRPIQIVLPDGTKANVPSNILSEAARAAAELRQSQHFQQGAAGGSVNINNNNQQNGKASSGNNNNLGLNLMMLEIPGDDLNPLSSALRLQLAIPQRVQNQEWKIETKHGVVQAPMFTTLPMLFIGNSDQVVQLEFSTGLKSAGLLTGRAVFAPSVCAMKRPAASSSSSSSNTGEDSSNHNNDNQQQQPTSYTTKSTKTSSSTAGIIDGDDNTNDNFIIKQNNNNNQHNSNGHHQQRPKLPEKSISGPLFFPETSNKLCDAASESEVEQILEKKIADQYPEYRANVTAGALRFGIMVMRGNCTFKEKIQRAQRLGAKYVIIANQDNNGGLLEMADSPTPVNDAVTIPAVFISHKDGELIRNYVADEEKKLADQKMRRVSININAEENNNNNEQEQEQQTTSSSSSIPAIKVEAKIKCVEGVVDQFESLGIALLEVPNLHKFFFAPLRLRSVAVMLKEQSAGVFPQILMDDYHARNAELQQQQETSDSGNNNNNNNKKISAYELINQYRCVREGCYFFLSYFMNSGSAASASSSSGGSDSETNSNGLPSWSSLKNIANRVVGSSNLVSLFSFKVGTDDDSDSGHHPEKESQEEGEEQIMMNSENGNNNNNNNNNNQNDPSQFGIVGTVVETSDPNLISSGFRFSRSLTYVMSSPFMYFDKKNSNNNNKCAILKIEIMNRANVHRDETKRDFEGTEAAIQVLLRKEGKNDFGICMRLVGEDPDKKGRYLAVTGFISKEKADQYLTMPSTKTRFNDLHVLLLRQKLVTVNEVTMDLKKNVGQYY